MRAGWVWVALLVGCGGGKDGSGAPIFEDDDDAVAGDPCEDIPSYNTEGMTCDERGSAFEVSVGKADLCEVKGDCRVVHPPCENWNNVGCYYVVNDCLTDADLSELYPVGATCSSTQDCGSCLTAPTADCIDGRCELVGDYGY